MGNVANFVGRIFARLGGYSRMGDREVDPPKHEPSVEEAHTRGFEEGVSFALELEDEDEGCTTEQIIEKIDEDLQEIEDMSQEMEGLDPTIH